MISFLLSCATRRSLPRLSLELVEGAGVEPAAQSNISVEPTAEAEVVECSICSNDVGLHHLIPAFTFRITANLTAGCLINKNMLFQKLYEI
jgi:hypothetical protein